LSEGIKDIAEIVRKTFTQSNKKPGRLKQQQQQQQQQLFISDK